MDKYIHDGSSQTLPRRVCTFLQLKPPTLRASADELEHAAAAALLAAFWQARTSCELLSCVVFDAATGTLLPWDVADAVTGALRFAAGVLVLLYAPCASHRCPAMTQRHLVPLALHI